MRRLLQLTAPLIAIATVILTAQATDVFDVVSVKSLGPASPEALARYGVGCDGGFPRIENRRFAVATTAYALITWAYGFNKHGGCGFVNNGNFLIGGPDWVRSERFEVQGVMPEAAAVPTLGGFMNGSAPALEAMLRAMLADRFKLEIHREMRDAPVYALVPARGGVKVPAAKAGERTTYRTERRRDADGLTVDHLIITNGDATYFALMLTQVTRKPVIDRTGLQGSYSFDLPYAPQDATGDSSGASLFTALQEQLGLRLEDTRAPVEVVVIDRAERPSEN